MGSVGAKARLTVLHAMSGVLFESDVSGDPLMPPPQAARLPGQHDPWVSAGRIHLASDPGRQRGLAAQRPPHLPRAADLRPQLLLVRLAVLKQSSYYVCVSLVVCQRLMCKSSAVLFDDRCVR
jgi:hypothetical protein